MMTETTITFRHVLGVPAPDEAICQFLSMHGVIQTSAASLPQRRSSSYPYDGRDVQLRQRYEQHRMVTNRLYPVGLPSEKHRALG